jgi:cobalt-zinc-cadmium efflux system outer membrane protein
VGITIPLPLWNQNKGAIETAKARLQQAQASLLVTRRDMERQVVERLSEYQKRLEEMSHWQPDSAARFKEAADLSDQHYRLGALPVATYMEMQRSALDALDALLSTEAEAFEERQQLELLTGRTFAK